jgi:hypothetical protein
MVPQWNSLNYTHFGSSDDMDTNGDINSSPSIVVPYDEMHLGNQMATIHNGINLQYNEPL